MEKKVLQEIAVKQIKIEDSFWSEIQNRIIDVVIPFQEKVLRDEVPGVAKWLEGSSIPLQ